MSYVTFLSFIVATGLYWLMGAGGPVHRADALAPFRHQLGDSDAVSANRTLLWLVIAPSAVFGLVYAMVALVVGSAGTLLLATLALFFAFGREDYPTLTQRFLARAKAGDHEGAARVVETAGGPCAVNDADELADTAAAFFSMMALQRWFGPVIYCLLLGPVGAVAYRLAHMTQATGSPVSESMMRMIEWLPSRLLVLSFAVFGDFDKTLTYVVRKGLSSATETQEFFEDAQDAALAVDGASLHERLAAVFQMLERCFLLWVGAVALLVLI